MATFNLQNEWSKGIQGNIHDGNVFKYDDEKLLTRIKNIEAMLGIVMSGMGAVFDLASSMGAAQDEMQSALNDVQNEIDGIFDIIGGFLDGGEDSVALTIDEDDEVTFLRNKVSELTETIAELNKRIDLLSSMVDEPMVIDDKLLITSKSYIMKTSKGKVVNYRVKPTGLTTNLIKVYINGVYSHTLKNVENNKEITVFSEVLYQEFEDKITDIMIEDEMGNISNSIQFIVDVIDADIVNEITLTQPSRNIFCAQHDVVNVVGIIEGLPEGFCNVYVNGKYNGFLQNVENGEETVLYSEKITETKLIRIYVEYPEGNRSREVTYAVIVDRLAEDEEDEIRISSTEYGITTRYDHKTSLICSVRGLKSDIANIYINGSYHHTIYIDEDTDFDHVIIYEERMKTDKLIYVFIDDGKGNRSNTITYEITLLNRYATVPLSGTERTLTINSDDLDRQPILNEQVICKADISGLTGDWCNVYVNGLYNRRLTLISGTEDIILYDFKAEKDCEVEIQIEDKVGYKSNVLRFCIHIQEVIDAPNYDEEYVISPPDGWCQPYSKLIGGNRSTWAKGAQELVSDISKLSINSLTLSVRMLIKDLNSIEVKIDEEDLHLVKETLLFMKSQGLLQKIQMILEPCPCINKGEVNEREFKPFNEEMFIINWRNEIIKLLNELKDYTFWGIYVNTNMDVLYKYPNRWQEIYDTIKEGRPESNIMIKTNWWESNYDSEDMLGLNTKCTHPYFKIWDVVAISAYFPLSKKAAVASYDNIYNWVVNGTDHSNQAVATDIRTLHQALNKPIMFGELGIPALLFAVVDPYDKYCGYNDDEITQTNWFKVWHDVFINEEWFLGWQFYHMSDLYNSPYDPTDRAASLFIASIDAINKYKK